MTSSVQAAIASLLIAATPGASAQSVANIPPIEFKTDVRQAELPPAPDGFEWHRIEEIQTAVITPVGWYRYAKQGPFSRIVAFSPERLNDKGQFEVGLTVSLMWHPQLRPGLEAKATDMVLASIVNTVESNQRDNKVLLGKFEERNGKKMLIVRHRNAPANLPPIIVHKLAIGDPVTGLVYQFLFESPEQTWEENWKTGEQILKRIFVLFQPK